MAQLNREQMIELLENNNVEVIGTSEGFDGAENGIWISGEGDDYRINYWTENYEDFTFGVHNELNTLAEENGWFFEWHDAGTLMCWPQ